MIVVLLVVLFGLFVVCLWLVGCVFGFGLCGCYYFYFFNCFVHYSCWWLVFGCGLSLLWVDVWFCGVCAFLLFLFIAWCFSLGGLLVVCLFGVDCFGLTVLLFGFWVLLVYTVYCSVVGGFVWWFLFWVLVVLGLVFISWCVDCTGCFGLVFW